MYTKISKLSVFFPTYNEEGNIESVVKDTKKVLEKVADSWEIIIVNDGSKDNTREVAEKLVKSDKRIRLVNHKVNRGYGGALKTGFESAKYEWVAFADSDGQFDFSEITKFIEKKDDADLILGYRLVRADSLSRKVFTFGWKSAARVLLGLDAKDYSCGFKLIKKKVYQDVQPLVGEEKVTQIELLVKAKRKGFKFAEVGVHHYPRKSGKQTGADLKVVFKSIQDLFKLWMQLR
jgi:glycosyltransferase involved in cell wall biosynthesis